jgi:hypothetical protein
LTICHFKEDVVTNKEFLMVLGAMVVFFLVAVFMASKAEAEKTIYLEDGSTVITDENVFVFEGSLYTLTGGRANKLVIKPAIPLEVEEDEGCGLTFGGSGCSEEEAEEESEEQECDGLTFGGGEC